MRIAVVVNHRAGPSGAAAEAESLARELLAKRGHVIIPLPDGDLDARLAAAAASVADVVLVGGGDGTVNAAAARLTGTGKPLALLPLGTANLLARDLHVPLSLYGALDAIGHGVAQPIDLGEVNGHLFVSKCMIGATSRLSVIRRRLKQRFGSRAWVGLLAAFLAFWRPAPALAVTIETASGQQRQRVRVLAVLNNEYDEAPGRVFARARLDRGVLTVYTARRPSPASVARIAAGMLAGHWKKARFLSYQTVTGVTIHARPKLLHMTIDGDLIRVRPPLRFTVRPGALTVLVPRPARKDGRGKG